MRTTTLTSSLVILSLSILAGGRAANAADQSDPGWRLKLTGASIQSTGGGGFSSSIGGGLGVEYRASDRFGIEFGAVTGKVDDKLGFDFFGEDVFTIETSLRVTPLLGRLNFHLTPGHKADLYLGPVAGWVRYGDIDVRVSAPGEGSLLVDHVQNKDGFAWGGHIGLDVPFGRSGFFFTSDATYLRSTVKPTARSAAEGAAEFDLNPLIVQAGLGIRF
jgi:outer membrane protein W